jgi:hypothetical protein
MNLQTGDNVLIECDGRRVPGVVMLASGNGKSLVLEFDALLDGHLGMMAVSLADDGKYSALLTGSEVVLIKRC